MDNSVEDIKRGYDIVRIIGWNRTEIIVDMLGWDRIGIIVDTMNSGSGNFTKIKNILVKTVGLKDAMYIIKIVGLDNIKQIIAVVRNK